MPAEPLRDAARRRSDDAVARGRAAIAGLARRGEQVTFQAVAREAGVSRQWLYTQAELRGEIERARAARVAPAGGGVPAAQRSSEASLRQRLKGLLDETRRLRQENAELREELALAYGRQREAQRVATAGHAG